MEALTPRRRLIEALFGVLAADEPGMDTDETYAVLVEIINRLDSIPYRSHVDPRRGELMRLRVGREDGRPWRLTEIAAQRGMTLPAARS